MSYKSKNKNSDEFYLQYYTRVKKNYDTLSQSEYDVTALIGALLSTLVVADERLTGKEKHSFRDGKLDEYISDAQAEKILNHVLYTINERLYHSYEQNTINLSRVINHMRNALAHDGFSFDENQSTHEISAVRFISNSDKSNRNNKTSQLTR